MKNKIIKKVIEKLSKRPMLGSFYLLEGKVYYSTSQNGIDHKKLWNLIVNLLFKKIDSKDRKKMLEANYGADRGRVSWTGELIDNTPIGEGKWIIEGTPGCVKYEKEIRSNFGLSTLPKSQLKIDWQDNEVYITIKDEKEVVKEMLEKYKIPVQSTHVAKLSFLKLD